jgi:hypothetical protein
MKCKIQTGREFRFQGHRSQVTSTQIFCATHLCPPIHPHTKYQPKIFIHLGDTERKGISVSRSKVASTRFFRATHLCPLIHPITKYQQKIFICFEDTERKGIIMQFWVNFGAKNCICICIWGKVKGLINIKSIHLCPLIHPHTKYQPKIFSRSGIREIIRTVDGKCRTCRLEKHKASPNLRWQGCLINLM